jgi:mannose-6-phosphate isomerase-like protein (cupin superfamily)
MEISKVNLKDKLSLFSEHWSPKIIGELNGQQVKLVKAKGEFDWHKHDDEDELFYVVKGSFQMELEDETIPVKEGEMIIIPKGTLHRPVAKEEVYLMLFEPVSTLNTGDNPDSALTKENPGWI